MSEERRLAVLRAIVQDYVHTSEPVGSKALVERHGLGVSAATVRNDMALLEEEGLIHAPHTSAGRVPTDAGYRRFVDQLHQVKPMSQAERRAIAQFLDGAVDLDDIVDRTVRLLSGLTKQVAVVQYPSLTRSTVRHIELVPIGGRRLMVVLIANTGRVEQRVVEIPSETVQPGETLPSDLALEGVVATLRAKVNAEAAARSFTEATERLSRLPDEVRPEEVPVLRAVLDALDVLLVETRQDRVVLAGQSNLVRFGADFPTTIGPVLEALEEHVVLLRLLQSLAAEGPSVAVSIGHENPVSGLHSTSVVTSGYGPGTAHVASLGVLGPTRMDYPTTMAAVRAVARYVSNILDEKDPE